MVVPPRSDRENPAAPSGDPGAPELDTALGPARRDSDDGVDTGPSGQPGADPGIAVDADLGAAPGVAVDADPGAEPVAHADLGADPGAESASATNADLGAGADANPAADPTPQQAGDGVLAPEATVSPSATAEQRTWVAKLSSSVASTGRMIWDIPGNIARSPRPSLPQLRGTMPDPPLGARQVSHGYVDDLWQARPTLDRPYPVVLIHGTISSKNVWQNLVLRLREDNFVVFAPDFGVHGTQDIPTSAEDVGAYIEQVREATGAEQVDVVGHSQGGLLARYWINEMGGEDVVHHLVSLGAPHRGTTLMGMLGPLLTTEMTQRMAAATIRRVFGAAGMQQIIGSPLMDTLAASPDTRPHIRYTCLATRNDSTVVPHENAFLSEREDAVVHNAFVQDLGVARCRHDELPSHPGVQALVHRVLLEALEDDLDDLQDGEGADG